MLRHRLHAIAGLPRAGSTLLAALLGQNPRIHAEVPSPVGPMLDELSDRMRAGSEIGGLLSGACRRRMASGLVNGYYADVPDEVTTVLDTNRGWPARLPELLAIAPEARIICCVRDVAWVLDSLERMYRQNPFETTALFDGPSERSTVYARAETLAGGDRLVGVAWSALKEAVLGPEAGRVLLVEFEDLTGWPEQVLPLIYDFLGEPRVCHDTENVRFDAPEFDRRLGLPGLHRVEGPVRPLSRDPVLPPDLFQRFREDTFWRTALDSPANLVAPVGGDDGHFALCPLEARPGT